MLYCSYHLIQNRPPEVASGYYLHYTVNVHHYLLQLLGIPKELLL
uniref:Uncharacterized protein n=1 Tax=Podoviridae sp. ct8Lf7 TaxID=2827723 RepID=A0A8S5S0G7_9CAUD|nr:MAG TPA: hypothetical protein [Podoviridae sp. ct8Lf7]